MALIGWNCLTLFHADVHTSPTLRYVSGFLNAKPVVKTLSRSGAVMLELFKMAKDRQEHFFSS